MKRSSLAIVSLALLLCGGSSAPAAAQRGQGATPPSPRQAAPLDLTGYWVSVVTEDWRFRMVTPRKGDYMSVPLNAEGRKVADAWDPAKDQAAGEQCKSYGAAAIMRVPGRVHITWDGEATLKIETDAGQQTRLLRFGATPAAGADARTWQGVSVASWEVQGGGRGGGTRGGSLKVVTTRMRPGYLRKNGVPYSENTTLTEYFDRHTEPDGSEWFTVTTIVSDPTYLAQDFITTSHFRKEPDGSKWAPTPCEAM